MTKSFSPHEPIQYVFSNFQLEEKLFYIEGMEMVLPSHEPQIYVVKGHFFGEKMLRILCIDEAFFPHELVLCV